MASEWIDFPKNLNKIGTIASNFDGVIDEAIADRLKSEPDTWAEHPAWDFYGKVWFASGKFHEAVMRYGSHIATKTAENYSDLMNDVNQSFGDY